jgi:hypothetical protein
VVIINKKPCALCGRMCLTTWFTKIKHEEHKENGELCECLSDLCGKRKKITI